MTQTTEVIQPPRNPLRYVFNRETLEIWRAVRNPSSELAHRIEIAEASGPLPSEPDLARKLMWLRAKKAAWHAYVYTGFACGMFEGEHGNNLLGRLRSSERNQFRPAMAECMTCWFLAGRMRMPIDTRAPGRDRRVLEMKIVATAGEIGVEVKAPFEEIPEPVPGESSFRHVDDAGKLSPAMKHANRQFGDTTPNLLVIAPSLERSVVADRNDLIRAAYGESKITSIFDPESGTAGEATLKFFPEGKFLETRRPGGKLLKPDGLPAYRRISAILCIEERMAERYPHPDPRPVLENRSLQDSWYAALQRSLSLDNEMWIEHDAILVHNPYAYHALPHEPWQSIPQLLPVGESMEWSDRFPISV